MNILRTKIAFIGDTKVGKTNIINSVVKQNFQSTYLSTLGVDFSTHEMKVKETNYTLQIQVLDTSGNSIFRDLVNSQLKDVNFLIYCFDVTSKESFNTIKIIKDGIKDIVNNKKCVELLVGNKTDLDKKMVVNETDVKNLASSYNMQYFLVSALQSNNTINIFNLIMETVYNNYIAFLSKIKSISN